MQWRIQGRSSGGPLPLIFRPNNSGPKGGKLFFWRPPPPPYLRVWMTAPSPLISRSGSGRRLFFFRMEYAYSCSISLKQSPLIPISGLRGYFSVNGTVLIGTSGKCDSGAKFTSPEFCVPYTQTMDRPVCPCKWKNNCCSLITLQ